MRWTASMLVSITLGACLLTPMGAQAKEKSSANADLGTPYINAALWQQTAAERKALCYQTYNAARQTIAENIRTGNYVKRDGKLYEENWVKNADGTYTLNSRPLAIVLDLDETVFDNSVYQCWMALHPSENAFYGVEKFFEYQSQMDNPPAMPGAIEFLKQCHEWGITPIYITDRDAKIYHKNSLATLRNMGLGTSNLDNELFCRDKEHEKEQAQEILKSANISPDSQLGKEIAKNASNKSGRRWYVSTKYKVLAYFGDDLYDHPVVVDRNAKGEQARALRQQQVEENSGHFGVDWFVLPNPLYGSWRDKSGFPLTDNDKSIEGLKAACTDYDKWLEKHK